jgi:hypothetical protein
MIEQQPAETNLELKLLAYMVMSEDVIDAASRRYRAGELKSNYFTQYNKRIFHWLIRYYEKLKKPPKHGIKDIWDAKKKSLPSHVQELMEFTLENLADLYAAFEEDGSDPKDVSFFDLPNFIRQSEISIIVEKAQNHISKGELDRAAELFEQFHDVKPDELEDEDMGVIMPATKKDLIESNKKVESKENIAYEFDDPAIAKLFGPLRKSWLVAVTGTEKSGKSFFMDEIAYDAVFYQGKKVLKVNLELSEELQRRRVQRRITSTCDEDDEGFIVYPVLDCENNQYGTCQVKSKQRKMKKRGALFEFKEQVIGYANNKSWTTCTECLNNPKIRANAHSTKRFIPCLWFDRSKVKAFNGQLMVRALKQFRPATQENLRIKSFPRFSKTFDEVRTFIFRYIERQKWQPDIIILDYVDITAQVDKDIRIDTDTKWKQASQLAGELNVLVINADQANKASRVQYQLDQLSTTESKTKDAHLDIRIALNRTETEMEQGITRLGVLFHRHKSFSINHEVLITQRLETSQALLEAARIFEREKKYPVCKEIM